MFWHWFTTLYAIIMSLFPFFVFSSITANNTVWKIFCIFTLSRKVTLSQPVILWLRWSSFFLGYTPICEQVINKLSPENLWRQNLFIPGVFSLLTDDVTIDKSNLPDSVVNRLVPLLGFLRI